MNTKIQTSPTAQNNLDATAKTDNTDLVIIKMDLILVKNNKETENN